MKSILVILFILNNLIFLSCNSSSSDPVSTSTPAGTFKVTGKISLDGNPVSGAVVQIGDVFNWKATTDAEGKFEITNVAQGEYYFKAEKKYDDNKTVFKKSKIALQNEVTDIGEIKLPNPMTLYTLDTSGISQHSVKIMWAKSSDPDFVEYKLYRRTDPGLDENTGELVYVSTNINDTVYTDSDFRTGISLYYRIYALTSSDRYSGSNLKSAEIPEVNLILNGSFETSSNGILPDFWLKNIVGSPSFNYFSVSSEAKHNGNFGLLITYDNAQANPPSGQTGWGGLIQTLETGSFISGEVYALSFWSKSVTGSIQIRLFKNGMTDNPIISYIVPGGQDWELHTFYFTYTSDINYYELWINTKQALASSGIVKAYLDDIKIIK
jgi:hypothetical protein